MFRLLLFCLCFWRNLYSASLEFCIIGCRESGICSSFTFRLSKTNPIYYVCNCDFKYRHTNSRGDFFLSLSPKPEKRAEFEKISLKSKVLRRVAYCFSTHFNHKCDNNWGIRGGKFSYKCKFFRDCLNRAWSEQIE